MIRNYKKKSFKKNHPANLPWNRLVRGVCVSADPSAGLLSSSGIHEYITTPGGSCFFFYGCQESKLSFSCLPSKNFIDYTISSGLSLIFVIKLTFNNNLERQAFVRYYFFSHVNRTLSSPFTMSLEAPHTNSSKVGSDNSESGWGFQGRDNAYHRDEQIYVRTSIVSVTGNSTVRKLFRSLSVWKIWKLDLILKQPVSQGL